MLVDMVDGVGVQVALSLKNFGTRFFIEKIACISRCLY